MQSEHHGMTVWTAVKRTPVTDAVWMLVGAMLIPGGGFLAGTLSGLDFVVGAVGGCAVGLTLRAIVVSARSHYQSSQEKP